MLNSGDDHHRDTIRILRVMPPLIHDGSFTDHPVNQPLIIVTRQATSTQDNEAANCVQPGHRSSHHPQILRIPFRRRQLILTVEHVRHNHQIDTRTVHLAFHAGGPQVRVSLGRPCLEEVDFLLRPCRRFAHVAVAIDHPLLEFEWPVIQDEAVCWNSGGESWRCVAVRFGVCQVRVEALGDAPAGERFATHHPRGAQIPIVASLI